MPIGHNGSNTYGVAKYVVCTDATKGTHTSISAANSVAVSGDQVYILQGSYTESDSNWVPGVQYFAGGDSGAVSTATGTTPAVTITGNQTFASAGNYYLSGLYFTATSGNVITISGSNAINLNMINCYIYSGAGSAHCFNFSNSGTSAVVFQFGQLDIASGASYYTSSATGSLSFFYSNGNNSGASTTVSTNSSGVVGWYYSQCTGPLSTSTTGILNIVDSSINCSALNATAVTLAGTGTSGSNYSAFLSGTAVAISVGAGTTLGLDRARINSSNVTPVSVAGTLNYSPISFTGTSAFTGAGTITPLQFGPTIYTPGITFTNQSLAAGDVMTNYAEQVAYTPTLTGSTTAGTTTYSQQVGHYTQIGKRVFLDVLIQYTAMTGTGNMQVSLPIAARSTTLEYFLGHVQTQNITTPTYTVIALATATTAPLVAQIAPGASFMQFPSYQSASAGSTIAAANPSSGTGLLVASINYLVT